MNKNKISGGTIHNMPDDLLKVLASGSKTQTLWESLTPLARNEWICWVTSVKKPETRKHHIKRVPVELVQGKRRPCCWLGCVHRTDKKASPSVRGILKRRSNK